MSDNRDHQVPRLMASSLPADPSLSQIPPAPQDLAWIVLGPSFAGMGLKLILYGISVSMFIHYVQSNWVRESRGIKILMVTVMVLQTADMGDTFASMMVTGISQRRDFNWLCEYTILNGLIYPAAICDLLVQAYLARRVCLLAPSRTLSWALAALFALGILTTFAGYIMFGVSYTQYAISGANPWVSIPGGLRPVNALIVAYSASAITDTLISASLVFLLLRNLRGFSKRSDSILKKISAAAVVTASYTAIVAITGATISLALKDTLYSEAAAPFFMVLPNLYTLSLFSTSIFRRRLQSQARGGLTPPTLPMIAVTKTNAVVTDVVPTLGIETEGLGVDTSADIRNASLGEIYVDGNDQEDGISETSGGSTISR